MKTNTGSTLRTICRQRKHQKHRTRHTQTSHNSNDSLDLSGNIQQDYKGRLIIKDRDRIDWINMLLQKYLNRIILGKIGNSDLDWIYTKFKFI